MSYSTFTSLTAAEQEPKAELVGTNSSISFATANFELLLALEVTEEAQWQSVS